MTRENQDNMYYKGMVGLCTLLLACCAYFLQGIFVKSHKTWDYMIQHNVEYKELVEDQSELLQEVKLINSRLIATPKFTQR